MTLPLDESREEAHDQKMIQDGEPQDLIVFVQGVWPEDVGQLKDALKEAAGGEHYELTFMVAEETS